MGASGLAGLLGRIVLVAVAAVAVVLAWRLAPLIETAFFGLRTEPRVVTARGELAADERATIDLFEAARDSVVFITTRREVRDPWRRDAFEAPRGSGSGFFWDGYGNVVTNSHVVAGASSATVRLADGRAFPARLVGTDPTNDLAVLRVRIGADQPSPLPIAADDEVQVGQKVLAIGNPFGLDWTLTTGVVSALDRDLPAERGPGLSGVIQTDAAINPGNSGGPLLDSAGRVIGVNTAIFSPSGASAGIGFAVPIDTVNRVAPQLIAEGRYRPPSFGARVDPRADRLLRRAGIEGAMVLEVAPGSPAEEAGLRPAKVAADGRIALGDVVTALDGEPVRDARDLRAALDDHAPGDVVAVEIRRGSERRTLELTLRAADAFPTD